MDKALPDATFLDFGLNGLLICHVFEGEQSWARESLRVEQHLDETTDKRPWLSAGGKKTYGSTNPVASILCVCWSEPASGLLRWMIFGSVQPPSLSQRPWRSGICPRQEQEACAENSQLHRILVIERISIYISNSTWELEKATAKPNI